MQVKALPKITGIFEPVLLVVLHSDALPVTQGIDVSLPTPVPLDPVRTVLCAALPQMGLPVNASRGILVPFVATLVPPVRTTPAQMAPSALLHRQIILHAGACLVRIL